MTDDTIGLWSGADNLWMAAGLALGAFHACGIWRTSRRPTAWAAVTGHLRVAAVGAVLLAAASAGVILPVAAGWTLGFLAAIPTTLTFQAQWASHGPETHSLHSKEQYSERDKREAVE